MTEAQDQNKEQQQQIAQQAAQIIELTKKLEEAQQTRAVADAVSTAHKPAPAATIAAQNAQRSQAVAAVGGNAFWASLPLEKRLASLGMAPTTDAECEEARKLFGRNSSALAKARMARLNWQRYARLRQLARELL